MQEEQIKLQQSVQEQKKVIIMIENEIIKTNTIHDQKQIIKDQEIQMLNQQIENQVIQQKKMDVQISEQLEQSHKVILKAREDSNRSQLEYFENLQKIQMQKQDLSHQISQLEATLLQKNHELLEQQQEVLKIKNETEKRLQQRNNEFQELQKEMEKKQQEMEEFQFLKNSQLQKLQEEKISQLELIQKELKSQNQVENHIKKRECQLDEILNSVQDMEKNVAESNKTIDQLKYQLEQKDINISSQQFQIDELKVQLQIVQQDSLKNQQELENQIKTKNQKIKEYSENIKGLKEDQKNSIELIQHQLNSEYSNAIKDLDDSQKKIDQLKNNIALLEKSAEIKNQQIDNLIKIQNQLKHDLDNVNKTYKDELNNKMELEIVIQKLKNTIQDQEQQISLLQIHEDTCKQQIQTMQEQQQNQNEKFAQLIRDQDKYTKQIVVLNKNLLQYDDDKKELDSKFNQEIQFLKDHHTKQLQIQNQIQQDQNVKIQKHIENEFIKEYYQIIICRYIKKILQQIQELESQLLVSRQEVIQKQTQFNFQIENLEKEIIRHDKIQQEEKELIKVLQNDLDEIKKQQLDGSKDKENNDKMIIKLQSEKSILEEDLSIQQNQVDELIFEINSLKQIVMELQNADHRSQIQKQELELRLKNQTDHHHRTQSQMQQQLELQIQQLNSNVVEQKSMFEREQIFKNKQLGEAKEKILRLEGVIQNYKDQLDSKNNEEQIKETLQILEANKSNQKQIENLLKDKEILDRKVIEMKQQLDNDKLSRYQLQEQNKALESIIQQNKRQMINLETQIQNYQQHIFELKEQELNQQKEKHENAKKITLIQDLLDIRSNELTQVNNLFEQSKHDSMLLQKKNESLRKSFLDIKPSFQLTNIDVMQKSTEVLNKSQNFDSKSFINKLNLK